MWVYDDVYSEMIMRGYVSRIVEKLSVGKKWEKKIIIKRVVFAWYLLCV